MASAILIEELQCSICLSIYTDPVTLRCGHNFCQVCIDRVLNTQEGSRAFRCPECRAEFQNSHVPEKNRSLCKIADCMRSIPEVNTGIFCTYCVHFSVPALKTCIECEASLCDIHCKTHNKSAEHVLIDPNTSLENRKCSIHEEILKYFCTEDAACICVSCSLAGEHRGHLVEMLDEASEKKKEKLRNVPQNLTTKREETEKRVQNLQERRGKNQEKAAGVTETVTALFRDIRRQLDDLEKRVLIEIYRQKESFSRSVFALIQQLEIKKDELSRKMLHIEELCINTEIYRREYTDILLDVNTAGDNIHISGDRKTASWSDINQNHPETPERFQDYEQVISSRRFSSGRHYWEVDVSKSVSWVVGMCYPSIDRRGDQSFIGYNNKSWGLDRTSDKYTVIHDRKVTQLPGNIPCNRLGIYLDYEAGQLSFYSLCDPIRHLHTVTATFTEPLHAALCVWGGCIKISGGVKTY
ncbi:E3 ubiquitin-protein ligase TRIM39-like [Mixophyes fleayi]|uniref:E3 ubiquitin-protein ligase TRIM39-like n=1 Tax=Mixophyes fleayi TaxID=3061075 RepID=UPI003F4DC746